MYPVSFVKPKAERNKLQNGLATDLAGTDGWVLSNLVKHLQNVHHLTAQVNKLEELPTAKSNENGELIEANNSSNENDISCIILDDGLKRNASIICDDPEQLFTQLSSQITNVMATVLINESKSNCMEITFALDESSRKLTVALIPGDGSCMFGALAHQLFTHAISSPENIEATKKLRMDVVDHILKPENFPSFEYHLKDRVYDSKSRH